MTSFRPTRVEIRPEAISANVAAIAAIVSPAAVCAVVKADGYGHGAVVAARAALAGGASTIGVALVEEAAELRTAGIGAPVLVLSEPPIDAWHEAAALGVEAMVYTARGIGAAGRAAAAAGVEVALHLKVDTGMHRVGCTAEEAVRLAATIVETSGVRLAGLATHFASADDPASMYTAVQLERFRSVDAQLGVAGIGGYRRHAANSAAALTQPGSRFEMVRCGIAIYGISPSGALDDRMDYEPAARLVSEVSFVKRLASGEPVSYGCRYVTESETTIATVPVGYADGVPRSFGRTGGLVLIGGRRFPVVGTVTMDQLMVDVGDARVAPGDEVVLLGEQGSAVLHANEVATREGTIGYEIVTRIGHRVPRVVPGAPDPLSPLSPPA